MGIDFGVMVLLTVLVWIFALLPKRQITRWQAAILLSIYAAEIAKLTLGA
jgi:hypothetical protein